VSENNIQATSEEARANAIGLLDEVAIKEDRDIILVAQVWAMVAVAAAISEHTSQLWEITARSVGATTGGGLDDFDGPQ
jgi:hypothetical protein